MPLDARARYEITRAFSARPSAENGCSVSTARTGASLPSGAGVLGLTYGVASSNWVSVPTNQLLPSRAAATSASGGVSATLRLSVARGRAAASGLASDVHD